MAAAIKIGQRLEGKIGTYLVGAQIVKDVWTATSGTIQAGKFIVKTAPQGRLENERQILKRFHGHASIRQLIDEVMHPPCLILQHLDADVLHASHLKTLEPADVKFVAKRVLQAIAALHEAGYTHTDIKPDNIFVNYGTGASRFSDVRLGDFGDVLRVDPKEYLKIGLDGPHVGAAIFRSPEAMLQLRWGQSTDIWSYGATLISLIWGLNWQMFKPDPSDATSDDSGYIIHIIIKQLVYFGPTPKSFIEIMPMKDTERWTVLAAATQWIIDNNKGKSFKYIEDECLTEEDREFLLRVMKFDSRDRPTARELLGDKWFDGVP
ncbi:Protein kinase-like (PK-like) [Glarea lozoyensis ATCC 20868]|uniref:Protein kinase-like (PK-like) n=1 Tax=Glarea lozoyensis (strain ATCC 20868 / MF5171) TaxID=1116229 RepID=S3DFA7_GLAL2|nr:Protein kinase-like (PK-like) [Glarea lozoyensis ATCC 20868]EPE36450.1 Protein kinase-like (PK-like) [Glarea lozoyensis ATCC 20868]